MQRQAGNGKIHSGALAGRERANNNNHKMAIRIRDAQPGDEALIADFNSRMALETEGRELEAERIGHGVGALLTDPAKGRYWLAIVDDVVVGQLMITYEWSDWRNGMLWWIQSVYIHPDFRRQGVFSSLYNYVKSLANADDEVCGIRLYVEDSNTRAQETYLALGMRKPGYQVLEVDFTKSPDVSKTPDTTTSEE